MASNDHTTGDPAIRKVQFTGGSTYTVSLPKDWARDQDLTAGAPLYLYSLEDRVVVAPAERSDQSSRVHVLADDRDPAAIGRQVRAAYVAGADEIAVEAGDGSLDAAARRTARSAITTLVGLGVTSESDDRVEARSMLDASNVSLDQTLAQLRQFALSMHREALTAVVECDSDLAESVRDRVGDVDRLVALVTRQFHAALVDVGEVDRLSVGRADAFRRVEVVRALAGVAEQATCIAAVATEQSARPEASLADDLDTVGASARDLVRTALGDEPAEAFTASESAESALEDLLASVCESDDPDATHYARLVEHLRQTCTHANRAARARLRRQVDGDR